MLLTKAQIAAARIPTVIIERQMRGLSILTHFLEFKSDALTRPVKCIKQRLILMNFLPNHFSMGNCLYQMNFEHPMRLTGLK